MPWYSSTCTAVFLAPGCGRRRRRLLPLVLEEHEPAAGLKDAV